MTGFVLQTDNFIGINLIVTGKLNSCHTRFLLKRSSHLKAELSVVLLGICYLVNQKHLKGLLCTSSVLGLMNRSMNKIHHRPDLGLIHGVMIEIYNELTNYNKVA